ncbi:mCG1051109, partial [Mus musculus]
MPIIPALERQRQTNLYKFKASLVKRAKFQDSHGYMKNFV